MPKQTDPALRLLVLESMIRKIEPTEAALKWVNEKYATGPDGKIRPGRKGVKDRMFRKIRASLKEDKEAKILLLKKEEYVLELFQSVQDTKDHIARLWALHDKVGTEVKKPALQAVMQQRLIMDINTLTIRLSQLYDALPFVAAVQTRLQSDIEKSEKAALAAEAQITAGTSDKSEEDLLREIVDGPKEDPAS